MDRPLWRAFADRKAEWSWLKFERRSCPSSRVVGRRQIDIWVVIRPIRDGSRFVSHENEDGEMDADIVQLYAVTFPYLPVQPIVLFLSL
jgi:hypothetical protein